MSLKKRKIDQDSAETQSKVEAGQGGGGVTCLSLSLAPWCRMAPWAALCFPAPLVNFTVFKPICVFIAADVL